MDPMGIKPPFGVYFVIFCQTTKQANLRLEVILVLMILIVAAIQKAVGGTKSKKGGAVRELLRESL